MTLRKFSLAIVFLIGVSAIQALAQGPSQARITFTASTPFELKGTNVVLPPGDYTLYSLNPRDREVFALYRGTDMKHSPLAILRTVRIYYSVGRLPSKTKMLMKADNASAQNYSMLEGWNVPGEYGWRVVNVSTNAAALSSIK